MNDKEREKLLLAVNKNQHNIYNNQRSHWKWIEYFDQEIKAQTQKERPNVCPLLLHRVFWFVFSPSFIFA